jgi:hypothetical protein
LKIYRDSLIGGERWKLIIKMIYMML